MYLGLEVDASQLLTLSPKRHTLEISTIFQTILYGTITLFGKMFQNISSMFAKI